MKIRKEIKRKPRIEMLPLIDIVFLLLVFFIYAMLSMAVHRGMPVDLPKSTTAKADKQLVISVAVKADGTIFVDKEPVPLNRLAEMLKGISRSGQETGVQLFADRALSYQHLFRVLDQIRQAGLSRISLQAERESSP
ncbi:MAG TPA: biopolymer transporter ExbD [Deltaproteobacteria bacterium]|nr:biopolymer transporter ExbD [Deltaproteobacteria bacterium]